MKAMEDRPVPSFPSVFMFTEPARNGLLEIISNWKGTLRALSPFVPFVPLSSERFIYLPVEHLPYFLLMTTTNSTVV